MSAWAKRELIRPEDMGIPGRSLAPWFVYLHAQCYKGIDFPEHDELENEVISQLAVDLKERSLEGTLQKFCLINIAAEDFSRAEPNGKFLLPVQIARIAINQSNRGSFQCAPLFPANQCENLFYVAPDSLGRVGAVCWRGFKP